MANSNQHSKASLEEVKELLKKYAHGQLHEKSISELAKKLIQLSPKELNHVYQAAGIKTEERAIKENPFQTLKAQPNTKNKPGESLNPFQTSLNPALSKNSKETNVDQANNLQNGIRPFNPNVLPQNQTNLPNPLNNSSLTPNISYSKADEKDKKKKNQDKVNSSKKMAMTATTLNFESKGELVHRKINTELELINQKRNQQQNISKEINAQNQNTQLNETNKKINAKEIEKSQGKNIDSQKKDGGESSTYKSPHPFKMKPNPYK